MARIRTIKPEFFLHEELYDSEQQTGLPLRLAFSGLWTQADREGRFVWRARKLKTQILPYDDVDFDRVLNALHQYGFIVKYSVDGEVFGCIPSWSDHQTVNIREPESKIPSPQLDTSSTVPVLYRNIPAHDENVFVRVEGKGREGKGKEGERVDVSTLSADADPVLISSSANSIDGQTLESLQTNKKAAPRHAKLPTLPDTLATPAMASAWQDWLQHRIEIRKPLRPTGAKKQIAKLVEMGPERALAALSHSMAQGWTGIYEPNAADKLKPDDDIPF